MKIISATDNSIGLCISGIGHIGLITWALMGNPFLSRDPFNDLMVTQVNIITEKQFQQERVGRASLSDDEYKGKLSIKKQNNENPLAINNGVNKDKLIVINPGVNPVKKLNKNDLLKAF